MKTEDRDRVPYVDQALKARPVICCRLLRYQIYCGKMDLTHPDGSRCYENTTLLRYDPPDITADGSYALMFIFTATDPGWIGNLTSSGDGGTIRILLPASELARYLDLLRNEKEVFFIGSFDGAPGDATRRLKWFDIANRGV